MNFWFISGAIVAGYKPKIIPLLLTGTEVNKYKSFLKIYRKYIQKVVRKMRDWYNLMQAQLFGWVE